ncbi:MAG: DUF4202 domain-containing protein [Gammaproteobacteria bacterium]|nr:DUF4202 domain-containing protein [Gammaproteobacteria bacterium]
MSQQKKIYQQALKLIDAANAEDPNIVKADGRDWPKELLYSERMTEMLDRYSPLAADAMKLAIRAQHIERWKSPRNAYPMDRLGYLKWRKDLYKIQADVAAKLLDRAGFDEVDIERVRKAVAKKSIKNNPDTQLLEDVTDLCFIEHYLVDFVARHPDYSEEKWIDIIRKTWNKMSDNAHQFALAGNIKLPESLAALILKAVSPED